MLDHLKDPQAISWDDIKEELGFTEAEHEEVRSGAQALIAQARAYRLARVRRRQHATQVDTSEPGDQRNR